MPFINNIGGINVFGNAEPNTLEQARSVASHAMQVSLMADNHLGYIMPIGGVVAYDNKISVSGVGFDIACGNAAVRTNTTLEELTGLNPDDINKNPHRVVENTKLNTLADEIYSQLSFGIGRKNKADDAPANNSLFNDQAMWIIPNSGSYRDTLIEKAREQLGTIGGGNHYVDIFVDQYGKIWVGVHFGSRGFGHTIATNFLALSAGFDWGQRVKEHEGLVDLNTTLGQDYWALMNLAGRYAYVGREWVVNKVARIMGSSVHDLVHNHHNFAWKERQFIDGEYRNVVVVRKGATPAFPGQRGFVGGSMGDDAVILKGSEISDPTNHFITSQQRRALYSTVHGAGRVMGRMEAKGKWKKGRQVRRGKISHKEMLDWLARKGVVLRGGDVDESPQAYRRLNEVLEAQGSTIEILYTLRPIIVCMAPANERDPYKD